MQVLKIGEIQAKFYRKIQGKIETATLCSRRGTELGGKFRNIVAKVHQGIANTSPYLLQDLSRKGVDEG
jgi:hypothetical protein